MSGKRRNNQLRLAFGEKTSSEVPQASVEGSETLTAKLSRSVANRQQSCDEICVPKHLLRLTRTSLVVRWGVAQSVRTAGCGPTCPVVWQGRRGDSPPMPIEYLAGE